MPRWRPARRHRPGTRSVAPRPRAGARRWRRPLSRAPARARLGAVAQCRWLACLGRPLPAPRRRLHAGPGAGRPAALRLPWLALREQRALHALSRPSGLVPAPRACAVTHAVREAYGLLWVRLARAGDGAAPPPRCRPFPNPAQRAAGRSSPDPTMSPPRPRARWRTSSTWPTSATSMTATSAIPSTPRCRPTRSRPAATARARRAAHHRLPRPAAALACQRRGRRHGRVRIPRGGALYRRADQGARPRRRPPRRHRAVHLPARAGGQPRVFVMSLVSEDDDASLRAFQTPSSCRTSPSWNRSGRAACRWPPAWKCRSRPTAWRAPTGATSRRTGCASARCPEAGHEQAAARRSRRRNAGRGEERKTKDERRKTEDGGVKERQAEGTGGTRRPLPAAGLRAALCGARDVSYASP